MWNEKAHCSTYFFAYATEESALDLGCVKYKKQER